MALNSMDDKMLGEKVDNYCSSSEDEEALVVSENTSNAVDTKIQPQSGKGVAQTGPKGVIEDWRSYKRLEHEKRQKDKEDFSKLLNKLSFTCEPHDKKVNAEDELSEDDEEFLKWYNKKRIAELEQKFASRWAGITFGKVVF